MLSYHTSIWSICRYALHIKMSRRITCWCSMRQAAAEIVRIFFMPACPVRSIIEWNSLHVASVYNFIVCLQFVFVHMNRTSCKKETMFPIWFALKNQTIRCEHELTFGTRLFLYDTILVEFNHMQLSFI